MNKEIGGEIERIIDVTGLRSKIEELKAEMAKGSLTSPKVEQLETGIKLPLIRLQLKMADGEIQQFT